MNCSCLQWLVETFVALQRLIKQVSGGNRFLFIGGIFWVEKGNHRGASLRLPLQPVRANAGLSPSSRICVLCSNTHSELTKPSRDLLHVGLWSQQQCQFACKSLPGIRKPWMDFYFCPVTIWEIETVAEIRIRNKLPCISCQIDR